MIGIMGARWPGPVDLAICMVSLLPACSERARSDLHYTPDGGAPADAATPADSLASQHPQGSDASSLDASPMDVWMAGQDAPRAVDEADVEPDVPIEMDALDGGSTQGNAALAVSPPSAQLVAISYEGAAPPAASDASHFHIANNSSTASGLLQASIVPAEAHFTIVSNTCEGLSLAAHASCDIAVIFAPLLLSHDGTAMLLVSDAANGTAQSAALTGTTWIADCLDVRASTTNLGAVQAGGLGREARFTVRNGCDRYDLGSMSAVFMGADAAVFRVSSNDCGNLAGGTSCVIGVQLAPPTDARPAIVSAVITLSGSNGGVQMAMLEGAVLGPSDPVTPNPSAISFGTVAVGQSALRIVTIQDFGSGSTDPVTIEIKGVGATQLAVVGSTCGSALELGETCQIAIRYTPVDATGVNGMIAVNAGAGILSIAVVGSAQPSPDDLPVDAGTALDTSAGDAPGRPHQG
jgi:hypothetical protein